MAEDKHIARMRGEKLIEPGSKVKQDDHDVDPTSEESKAHLLEDAEEANPTLHNVSLEMAKACSGATAPGEPIKLKGTGRIDEKVGKYGGDFTMFTDVARSSLVFNKPKDLVKSAVNIRKVLGKYNIKVVGLKNRFKTPTPSGYMDILVNLLIPIQGGKHNTELQLHLKGMHDAKQAQTSISASAYAELKASAEQLRGLHNDKGEAEAFQFNDKAMGNIATITGGEGVDGLSGHDLYNVSRYLNENHEKLAGAGGNLMGINLKETAELWDRIAKNEIYDPAAEGVLDGSSESDMKALKAISKL
jgi:hypothetical protein